MDLGVFPQVATANKRVRGVFRTLVACWMISCGQRLFDSPVELSRHVTVHWPSAVQCNAENCTIAVMLLCSLLRALHELQTEHKRRKTTTV